MKPKSPLKRQTYSPYWAIAEESEKSRMLFVNGAFIFVCILIFVLSGLLLYGAIAKFDEKPVVEQKKVNFVTLDNDSEYYFDELIVIDTYTYYENVKTHELGAFYFTVCFYDRNGELCYGSLRVDGDSEIRTQCADYLKNESAYVGDLLLSGYFSCSDIADLDSVLQTNYAESLEIYRTEWNGVDTGKHFLYDANSAEALRKNLQQNAMYCYLGSAALFLVACAGMVVLILWRKKLLKQEKNDTTEEQTSDILLNGTSAEEKAE